MAALIGLHSCCFRPDLDARVRRGTRRHVVAVATRLEQARIFTEAARAIIDGSALLSGLVVSATDDEIVFSNGAVLASMPCTSRGVRGLAVSTVLMDEAAFFVDNEGNQAAEQVFRALVPGAAQFGDGSRVILASTPFGESGFFADTYNRARDGELEDAFAVTATSAEMNPTLDPAFLSREHARDPEGFRSEYLAEFVGSGGAFLDPDRIAEAVTDRAQLTPEQATGWVAGLDPAFSSDPFGLALVARSPSEPARLVLGLARSWQPLKRKAVAFEERREREDAVLAEVADECLRYRARVVTDQYAAPAVVDYLRRRGLSVRSVPMTATSKTEVFAELRARLNSGALDLYPHPDLLAELRRVRTRYLAGSASVVNPRVGGPHGDLAQALALAVFESRGGPSSPDGARLGGDRELMRAHGVPAMVRYDGVL